MTMMSKNLVVLIVAFASLQLIQSYSGVAVLRTYNGKQQYMSPICKSPRSQQFRLSVSSTDSSAATCSPWKSVVSTNADLDEAVNEIIASAAVDNAENVGKYNLAIFFTSSIYEASAFKYDELFETVSKKMPGMKTMIGCTTGEEIRNQLLSCRKLPRCELESVF